MKYVPSIGGMYRHTVVERPVDEGKVAAVGGPGELSGVLRGGGKVALLRPGGGIVHTDVVAALIPLRDKERGEGRQRGRIISRGKNVWFRVVRGDSALTPSAWDAAPRIENKALSQSSLAPRAAPSPGHRG